MVFQGKQGQEVHFCTPELIHRVPHDQIMPAETWAVLLSGKQSKLFLFPVTHDTKAERRAGQEGQWVFIIRQMLLFIQNDDHVTHRAEVMANIMH